MGRLELLVPMNEYLELEYKVQIPKVDYPDIWDKHFAVYKKKKKCIYIYIYTHMTNNRKWKDS